jgi:hypothetical protein
MASAAEEGPLEEPAFATEVAVAAPPPDAVAEALAVAVADAEAPCSRRLLGSAGQTGCGGGLGLAGIGWV